MPETPPHIVKILETHSFTKPSDPGADWCVDCQNHNPCDARTMAEEWVASQRQISRTTSERPNTVLVIDDPESGVFVECEDEENTRVIVVDLGGGFDAYRLTDNDRPIVEEYVESWMAQAESLPASSKLRKTVEDTCDTVLRGVGSSLDEFRTASTVELS